MDNQYQEKFDDFLRNMTNYMFTFEVTKGCGYSAFVTIFKHNTLVQLYSNIISHFGNIDIKELYFLTPENERIRVPMSNQKVSEFVRTNIECNPIKLAPIYTLPKPVIYRLFLDDGNCYENHCSSVHYVNL